MSITQYAAAMGEDHPTPEKVAENVLSTKRRLAAILAADIAGYSRLMGEDEAATVRDLKAHQAVVLPLVGRWRPRHRHRRGRYPGRVPERDQRDRMRGRDSNRDGDAQR